MAWNQFQKKKKYGNTKVKDPDGRSYDSGLEREVFRYLEGLEKLGEIKDLCHHGFTVYLTEAEIGFRPDYKWHSNIRNCVEYGEAKGFETPDYAIKKRLWKVYGPGPLFIWKGSKTNFKIHETIHPKGTTPCPTCSQSSPTSSSSG